jgi:hypothetical protein
MIDEDVVIVAAPDLEEALADPELSGFIKVDVVNGEVKSTVFLRDAFAPYAARELRGCEGPSA